MERNLTAQLERLNGYGRAVQFEKKLAEICFLMYDWAPHVPDEDMGDKVPSFTKAGADVRKAYNFWNGLYRSFRGKGVDADTDINIDSVLSDNGDKVDTVMQFVSLKNSVQMTELEEVAQEAMGNGWVVKKINGSVTKQEEAEDYVKRLLRQAKKEGKRLWLIADHMCQRSFSIPEINVVLLTYDGGQIGASIQKMSRGATPGKDKSKTYIFTVSIDGNRDELVSRIILETAAKVSDKNEEDMVKSTKKVLRTFNVFANDEDNDPVPVKVDEFARQIFSSSTAHRVAVNRGKCSVQNDDLDMNVVDMMSGLVSVDKVKQDRAFEKTKTYKVLSEGDKKEKVVTEKELANMVYSKLCALIDTIKYTFDLYKSSGFDLDLSSYLGLVDTDKNLQATLNVTGDNLRYLIDTGYLRGEYLGLMTTL